MELDEDIEQRLLEYLHLEFGEAANENDSLKQSDLKYLGKFFLDGIETHYWAFPSNPPCWAIIKPFGDSYCLSMTVHPPEQLVKE